MLRFDDGRRVLVVPSAAPSCFLYVDPLAGGILVNTPAYDAALAREVESAAQVRFLFYPSARGAADICAWRSATGAKTVVGHGETIDGPVDERIDGTIRITGRLDFLTLPGVTPGTCALRSKAPPGIIFFGPALSQARGWPTLVRHADDWSWENRVLGAFGVAGLTFEYAFCDDYSQGVSLAGPGADIHVSAAVHALVG